MTEDASIRIDQTTLQRVYTCTQLGMEPGGDQPTEPILPCELSVVTSHPVSDPQSDPPCNGNCNGTVKCPRVPTRETH
jgi:hypothetical protein